MTGRVTWTRIHEAMRPESERVYVVAREKGKE